MTAMRDVQESRGESPQTAAATAPARTVTAAARTPTGDKVGRKWVILGSILGVAPFALLLPHADLFWTGVLSVVIGLVLASAFTTIIVFAQELVPGRLGMISGVFYGLAFGMGGLGAALLGKLADLDGIGYVYQLCAYLPLIGVCALLLPDIEKPARR